MHSAKLRAKCATCAVVLYAILVWTASADTFGSGANQFSVDFVTISGTSNPASGYGIVCNDYRMGVYEVTNDQWEKFEVGLGVPVTGWPTAAYDEDALWADGDVPVNAVSWYEAAQFANWLNTSTGHHPAYRFTGTQGTSDYTLATWSVDEAAGGTNLYRHKDALYFLPTEDEWVKAAYWNGNEIQAYSNLSASDIVGGQPDSARWNYDSSSGYEPWSVGAGARVELNGTFDMMGNVWEWFESPYADPTFAADAVRAVGGGAYCDGAAKLASSYRNPDGVPYSEGWQGNYGLRVAANVPEPSTLGILSLLGLVVIYRCR